MANPTIPNHNRCEITIVLPCLNEARTLGACVDEAFRFLRRFGAHGEVVVADNGSDDDSKAIALSHGARVVDVPLRGYGAAIHYGAREARGEFIIIADADGSYDLENLDLFVQELRAGAELVVGNRFRGGIAPGAMPWKNRYIGNPALSFIGRQLFGNTVGDFHCGLRAIRSDALARLHLSTRGMEYASEMIIKGLLSGLRVVEVPTPLRPDGRTGGSHLRPWRDGWRHLRLMLMFAHRPLFLYQGLALVLAGGGLMAALSRGPIDLFGMILDIHTMLYGAFALLIGVQCIMFGAFVQVYSSAAGLKALPPPLKKLLRPLQLEVGVAAGLAMIAVGVCGTLSSVASWGAEDFRRMDPQQGFRVVIPSATLLFLGIQVLFSSFFMSVLKLGLRRLPESDGSA